MSDRPITVLLVDEDPIFRLGLLTGLTAFDHIQIVGEAEQLGALRQQLEQLAPSVLLIDPQFPQQAQSGWSLLRELQRGFPQLKIALITASLEYDRLLAAKADGIAGYFPKGTAIADMVTGLEALVQGATAWPSLSSDRHSPPLSQWEKLLWHLFNDGLSQIDQGFQQVHRGLQSPQLSDFDRLFWQGRNRELTLAQWLVQRLMPRKLRQWRKTVQTLSPPMAPPSRPMSRRVSFSRAMTLRPPQDLARLSETLNQLPSQVENLTAFPLEIDILQPLKRQELLSLCQQQLQTTLEELRALRIEAAQLSQNSQSIVVEMWRTVTLAFLGKYCEPKSEFSLEQIQNLVEVYRPVIAQEKLNHIPFVVPLLEHLLFDEPLTVNQTIYPASSAEAQQYSDLYAQNLIIELANAAMVFILNYFANQEGIKVVLYEQSMFSSRQVARFRNDLTWHYQLCRYWLTPKQIFESQYTLLYLTPQGISAAQLYAPRQQELDDLKIVPLAVTLLLEFRDAISPRLRSVIEFLGNGLVFVLTQVVGRAIGLIGKGIIQGIGHTWQETRYGDRPNSRQSG